MLDVTFKNVGQGDSIVLEWSDNDINYIGIVDANKYNGNPVLEHIKKKDKPFIIKFVILSHPHFDHYSGILDILQYCLNEGIVLEYFLNTCLVSPGFVRACVKGAEQLNELASIFKFVKDNHTKMKMKVHLIQADSLNYEWNLGSTLYLKFLSPFFSDITNFASANTFDVKEEGVGNNSKANVLSTIIRIKKGDDYLLLTSDAPKHNFQRIIKDLEGDVDGRLLIGQSPHHGAKSNFNKFFWNSRQLTEESKIVFSVGDNHYGHPNEEVVKYFEAKRCKVFTTNYLGPFKGKKMISDKSILLNQFSQVVTNNKGNDIRLSFPI